MAGGPARQDGSSGDAPRERSFVPVRLEAHGPPIGRWFAIATIALVIVVVKPWPREPSPPGTAPGVDQRDVAESVAASLEPEPERASFCMGPASWLLATVERWKDQTIRVWRSIEPVTGVSGPHDSAIPIRPIGAVSVVELGWCAPIEGPEQLEGQVEVDLWRRVGTEWQPIATSSAPGNDTPQGALYRPGRKQTFWREGTYVLRIIDAEGHDFWLGVELQRRRPLD